MRERRNLLDEMESVGVPALGESTQNTPSVEVNSFSTVRFSMYGDFTPITVRSRSIPRDADMERG